MPNHIPNTKIKKQAFSTPSPKNTSNSWGLFLDFTSVKQQLTFAVHRDLQREVTVSKSHKHTFAILLKLTHFSINILLFFMQFLKHSSFRCLLLLLCLIITQSCGALKQPVFVTGLAEFSALLAPRTSMLSSESCCLYHWAHYMSPELGPSCFKCPAKDQLSVS